MNASRSFYHCILKAIFVITQNLSFQLKIALFLDVIRLIIFLCSSMYVLSTVLTNRGNRSVSKKFIQFFCFFFSSWNFYEFRVLKRLLQYKKPCLNIIFFKSEQVIWQKRCYVGQGEYQTVYQKELFFEKKSRHHEFAWLLMQFGATVIQQTQVSACPSASKRTWTYLKSTQLFSVLYFFAYTSKLNLQLNINFKNY